MNVEFIVGFSSHRKHLHNLKEENKFERNKFLWIFEWTVSGIFFNKYVFYLRISSSHCRKISELKFWIFCAFNWRFAMLPITNWWRMPLECKRNSKLIGLVDARHLLHIKQMGKKCKNQILVSPRRKFELISSRIARNWEKNSNYLILTLKTSTPFKNKENSVPSSNSKLKCCPLRCRQKWPTILEQVRIYSFESRCV